jgi:ubiquinone/menaquinone biosynthesis C-methylase UbiE
VKVNYDVHQHEVYARGRAMLPENARTWAEVFARHIARRSIVADIGSGTGHYSLVLAEALEAEVVGIEPSDRMRAVAQRESGHPHIRYVEGRAERLPLPDHSTDAALFSNVLHHVEDREACASELERIMRPGGSVLMRGMLPETVADVPFVRFFPEALPIAEAQVAAGLAAAEAIEARGFARVAQEPVEHLVALDLTAYADKLSLRAISTLELIDDAAFERGLERVRQAAAVQAPVTETMHVRILRAPDS